jgi:hypothetical protein
MLRRADTRAVLCCAALTLLGACSARVAQDKQGAERPPSPWADRVAGIMQPGWEVVQSDGSVVSTRKKPVTFYYSISLPAAGDELRAEMIEESKRAEKYQITLDIVDRLPDTKYQELKAANERTEQELEDLESRMGRFASKGSYLPTTPGEQALYHEYQRALASLPYHQLPDLYDEQYSVFVKTSRHPGDAFYSAREEMECRAVLENIYSFAEVYEGKKGPPQGSGWFGPRAYEWVAMLDAFESRRAYDNYQHKREWNQVDQPER